MLSRSMLLEEAISTVRRLKGVLQVVQLKEDERSRVKELEEQAEAGVMPSLGRGFNLGVSRSSPRLNKPLINSSLIHKLRETHRKKI